MWKEAIDRVGGLLKKAKGYAAVQMRRHDLKSAESAQLRRVNEMYRERYHGDLYYTNLDDVVRNLESFVAQRLYGWQRQDRVLSPDGRNFYLLYSFNFTETYMLGQLGCRLEPVSTAARMKVGMMAHQNQTEAVSVPYRITFGVNAMQTGTTVTVRSQINEEIDPSNQCPQVRSGHFRAPSMLTVRFPSGLDESVRQHLHSSCAENRPSFQEWYAGDEVRMMQEVCDLNQRVLQARRKVEEAESALKSLQNSAVK